MRIAEDRVTRIEAVDSEFVPLWSLGPVVQSPQTRRGFDLIVAAAFTAKVGDVRHVENPRQHMSYVILVPSERSTSGRFGAAGSPRLQMGGCAAYSSRAPGPPGTSPVSSIGAAFAPLADGLG